MNIAELKTQIKSNELDNVYIFIGEEIYIRNVYIDNIAEVSIMWGFANEIRMENWDESRNDSR